jgi:hypothetical protein
MQHDLVPVRKPIPMWRWDAIGLGPNDSIANAPAILAKSSLYKIRNSGERAPVVSVPNIEEH